MFLLKDLFTIVFFSSVLLAFLIHLEANAITCTVSAICFLLSLGEFFGRKNLVLYFWGFSVVFAAGNFLLLYFVNPQYAAYFGLFGPLVIASFTILLHYLSRTRPTILFVAITALAMVLCFFVNGSIMSQI